MNPSTGTVPFYRGIGSLFCSSFWFSFLARHGDGDRDFGAGGFLAAADFPEDGAEEEAVVVGLAVAEEGMGADSAAAAEVLAAVAQEGVGNL